MSPYAITIARSAEKELRSIDSARIGRIERAIDGLAENPRPHGCKKLRNKRNIWRVRVGECRILYTIDDAVRVVAVECVAHRKHAYD